MIAERAAASPAVVRREVASPAGVAVAGVTEDGACLVEFRDREILETQVAKVRARVGPTSDGSHHYLEQIESELHEYFSGVRRRFSVPLVYPGTPFQVKVWDALQAIPL